MCVLVCLLYVYSFPSFAIAEVEEEPPVETTQTIVEEPVEDTIPQTTEEPVHLQNAPEEETSEESDAIIKTGDATAGGSIVNGVNSNEVTTNTANEETTEEESNENTTEEKEELDDTSTTTEPISELITTDETPTSTPSLLPEEVELLPEEDNATTTPGLENHNDADVVNQADINAETGENMSNDNGNVLIDTGTAVASADILNVVNTNIYNSEGLFLFLSNLFGLVGDIDIRDYDLFSSSVQTTENTRESAQEDTGLCPVLCGKTPIIDSATTSQEATITNDVIVRSATGDNASVGNSGVGIIDTGNAYAAANVINVANTNVVDSNYLLMTFNNFGDWGGDVVFPAAEMFANLFGGTGLSGGTNVSNTNQAAINNAVTTQALTGGNAAENSDGLSIIETGDATSATNVINQVNTNLFGPTSFSILFNIHGSWGGDIFGAPAGLSWQETDGGIQLNYNPTVASGLATELPATISNTNTSTITNNIKVTALTGDNKVEGQGGAAVFTGNALAAANVINVANTNVIGQNWLYAIINVFGDWGGNISFGKPDLWIGGSADLSKGTPDPGTVVTYHYTIYNFGDAPATSARIRTHYDSEKIRFIGYDPSKSTYKNQLEWSLGDIPPGGSKKVSYQAQIQRNIPLGHSFINTTADVSSLETDENIEDNSEFLSFKAWRESRTYLSGFTIKYAPSPKLDITKTAATSTITASTTLDYEIVIENNGGGPAYDALLVDILRDEDGNTVYEEYWHLNTIYPGERIEVAYSTFFNDATKPGLFTNEAQVRALSGHNSFLYGRQGNSPVVKYVVKVLESPILEIIEEEEEIIEVVEESVKIEVEEIPIQSEPLIVIDLTPSLAALYLHPIFSQHPVHIDPYVGPHPYLHPIFSQHPVYITSPAVIDADEGTALLDGDDGSLLQTAGISFLNVLKRPFEQLSALSRPNYTKESKAAGNQNDILALLALSVFMVRRGSVAVEDITTRKKGSLN